MAEQRQDIKPFIESILDPQFVDSFYGPVIGTETITVMVYENPGTEPRRLPLNQMFPFMTLFDIKLAIYNAYKRDDKAHPDYVFLGIPRFGTMIETTDYTWSFSATPTESVLLKNLTGVAAGKLSVPAIDSRFVDTDGGRKNILRTNTDGITIEDKFFQKTAKLPVLHAYLYRTLEAMIPGERPLSERDWNGRLYPYFPALSIGNDTLTLDQRNQAKKFADNFVVRRRFFAKIDEILETGAPMTTVNLSAVKYIRLSYTKPKVIPGIEVIFYEVPVNERRPYMRLMPVENTAISKVHMLKDSDVPNLEDPRLLYIWSQEKNPTPDRDFAMTKILLRKRSGNTIPLYATMRMFDDGTADITVEPPKPFKKLDPLADLATLADGLTDALTGFSYLREMPLLKNGNFRFIADLKDFVDTSYTLKILRRKLQIMSAAFQEIPSIGEDQPLMTLRYKLVSNFSREDRIQAFITQLLTRNPMKSQSDETDRLREIANEFQITGAEAKRQLDRKMEAAGEVVLANPETRDYTALNNPGVDIAIFSRHPTYFFEIYRADSYVTIQRIITLLSLLFSRPAEEFRATEEEMEKLAVGEKELSLREDAGTESESEAGAEPQGEGEAQSEADAEFENVFENVEGTPKEEAGEEEEGEFADLMMNGPTLEETEEERKREEEEEEEVQRTTTKPLARPKVVAPKNDDAESVAAPRKGFEKYFSDKLSAADKALFNYDKTYDKTNPGPPVKKYVQQCGANLMRQPAVLSPDQYERMRDEYKAELDSGEIRFFEFPLAKDAKDEPYDANPEKMEYYTIMKYGSEGVRNYYLCCKYYCVRDEMLVRKVEFEGTKMRPGHYKTDEEKVKPQNTCPMCKGKQVMNRSAPGPNETVIMREGNNGSQLYINFLKKTFHPDGLYLPCCFKDDQAIRIGSKQFPESSEEVRDARRPPPIREANGEEPAERTEDIVQKFTVSYETTILTARTASIVGVEKMPLDPVIPKTKKARRDKSTGVLQESKQKTELSEPQIGLLPTKLNEYFSQDTKELVGRKGTQQLRPNSKGFLRVGVENRGPRRKDSFLAAVAPFFRFNSVSEFKTALARIIQAPLYMGLNFGNLLLELYVPKWIPRVLKMTGEPATDGDIEVWAKNELGIPRLTESNEALIRRAYLSYDRFCWWLQSETELKEYRHFAHFFSLPGIMNVGTRKYTTAGTSISEYRRPGILFIVLDILESGEMKVRCPPYPIDDQIFSKSDIAFLAHHYSGVWEPIFYYNNEVLSDQGSNQAFLTFSAGQRKQWPSIIEERLKEFRAQCSMATGGLGIYASSRGLNSRKIVPLLKLRNVMSKHPEVSLQALLRDSYNHVAALLYKTEKSGLIAIPVIEDGITYSFHKDVPERGESAMDLLMLLDTKTVFDWDDYTPASVNQVVEFYRRFVEPHFPDLYTVKKMVTSRNTQKIVAVRLSNGLFIPVSAPEDPARVPDIPVGEIEEMEWKINKDIVIDSTTSEREIQDSSEIDAKEFNETFEHLRITFSNWLNSSEDGGNFRRELEQILSDNSMPLFERRRRVEIMIGPVVEGWISEKDEDAPRQPSLLRVDCTLRSQEECGGSCVWVESKDTRDSKDKCMIHVKKIEGEEGSSRTSATRILLRRLIEELLRFSNRRQEIFEKRVSQLAVLDQAVRQGEQYILPEKSAAWTELLRLEWATRVPEEPKYLEEMRRKPAESEEAPLPPVNEVSALPVAMETLLGAEDPKTARLRMYPSPTGSLEPFLSLLGTTAATVGMKTTDTVMTSTNLFTIIHRTNFPIIQYDLRKEPPKITDALKLRGLLYNDNKTEPRYGIFVITDDRPPSLLVTDTEYPALLKKSELPDILVKSFIRTKATTTAAT